MSRKKKTIEEKVQELMPEFYDIVLSLSDEHVSERLAKAARHLEEVRQQEKADEKLNSAKESVKVLSEPYRECKKAVGLRIQFLVKILEDRKVSNAPSS